MGIQAAPLTEFYYSVEGRGEDLFNFWSNLFDNDFLGVAENAAQIEYDRSDSVRINDWPLVFTIYDRNKKKLGVFVVEIGGWEPEFVVNPIWKNWYENTH